MHCFLKGMLYFPNQQSWHFCKDSSIHSGACSVQAGRLCLSLLGDLEQVPSLDLGFFIRKMTLLRFIRSGILGPEFMGPQEVCGCRSMTPLKISARFWGCTCAFFLEERESMAFIRDSKYGVVQKWKSSIPLQEIIYKVTDCLNLLGVIMWLSPCPKGKYSPIEKNPEESQEQLCQQPFSAGGGKGESIFSVSVLLWNGNNMGDFWGANKTMSVSTHVSNLPDGHKEQFN